MDIEEIRSKQHILKTNIDHAIEKFNKETGVIVSDIDLEYHKTAVLGKWPEVIFCGSRIQIDLE